nr:hypothetical protein [Candidatus Freyarchaeota archaeon]
MAPRKVHLAVGLIVYFAFTIIFYYWYLGLSNYLPLKMFGTVLLIPLKRTLTSADMIYLAVALLLVLTGAEIADYDKAIMWLQHRDWLTHSCILPGIFSAIVIVFTFVQIGNPLQTLIFNPAVNTALLLGLAVFSLGAASHLFLDYFPPIKPEELHSKKGSLVAGHEAADYYISGMTGQELFRRLEGTALVHFWWQVEVEKEEKKPRSRGKGYELRRTLQPRQSQAYYMLNGTVLLIIAGLLLYLFMGLQSGFLQTGLTWQQFLMLFLLFP